MSGGYRDDIDEGLLIDYTGEGGQTGGKHVSILTSTCQARAYLGRHVVALSAPCVVFLRSMCQSH